MVYLDNAATTFPKPRHVLREVGKCLANYCGNPGRSTHNLAIKCAEKIFEARERVANFISLSSPERVIFTQNATHALNFAIKGCITEKCHVITSDAEHNSVLRPLYKQMSSVGIGVSYFDSTKPLRDTIPPLIRNDTKFIVCSIASNVTGHTLDCNTLSRIASENGLITIIDASQYIGHLKIDLKETPFDIICAPGHKSLFGIQGSGFLAFNRDIPCNTILEGGSGGNSESMYMPDFMPEKFESGTVNTPAIISLSAGISYLMAYSHTDIAEKISDLTARLREILDECGAIIYGCENGIASFNLKGIPANTIARVLNEAGIACRGGLHCAPLMHRKLGTEDYGTVRASLSILNSSNDLDKLYYAINNVIK